MNIQNLINQVYSVCREVLSKDQMNELDEFLEVGEPSIGLLWAIHYAIDGFWIVPSELDADLLHWANETKWPPKCKEAVERAIATRKTFSIRDKGNPEQIRKQRSPC
jgi:hypothetical protein